MKQVILFTAAFFACGDSKPASVDSASAANLSSVDVAVKASCFEKFTGKLDEMLTKAEILSVYPSLPADAEYTYSRSAPIDYQTCEYHWKSDRTYMMKVGSKEMEVPKPNKIGVGLLSTYGEKIKDPLDYFKNAYRTPTEEEIAEFQKMAKKKMEEEGLTAPEQKAGQNLTSSLADRILFTSIEGIGDAAAWDHMDSALVILVGRTRFKIYAEISSETEENQELAKKLARLVLFKC